MDAPDELQMLLQHRPMKHLNAEAQVPRIEIPVQRQFHHTPSLKRLKKLKSLQTLTASSVDLHRSTSSATESVCNAITYVH